MKKYIILSLLLLGCKPAPTYNAFDDEFDISITQVVKNGCDTISAECGWFNLQQKEGRLRNYYQIFIDSDDVVDAKGFVYFLDTLKVKGFKNIDTVYSLKISEKNINELNSELKKFNFNFLNQFYNKASLSEEVRIINFKSKDTINLNVGFEWIDKKDSIVARELSYWRPRKLVDSHKVKSK